MDNVESGLKASYTISWYFQANAGRVFSNIPYLQYFPFYHSQPTSHFIQHYIAHISVTDETGQYYRN
jgi:hypothetical protein